MSQELNDAGYDNILSEELSKWLSEVLNTLQLMLFNRRPEVADAVSRFWEHPSLMILKQHLLDPYAVSEPEFVEAQETVLRNFVQVTRDFIVACRNSCKFNDLGQIKAGRRINRVMHKLLNSLGLSGISNYPPHSKQALSDIRAFQMTAMEEPALQDFFNILTDANLLTLNNVKYFFSHDDILGTIRRVLQKVKALQIPKNNIAITKEIIQEVIVPSIRKNVNPSSDPFLLFDDLGLIAKLNKRIQIDNSLLSLLIKNFLPGRNAFVERSIWLLDARHMNQMRYQYNKPELANTFIGTYLYHQEGRSIYATVKPEINVSQEINLSDICRNDMEKFAPTLRIFDNLTFPSGDDTNLDTMGNKKDYLKILEFLKGLTLENTLLTKNNLSTLLTLSSSQSTESQESLLALMKSLRQKGLLSQHNLDAVFKKVSRNEWLHGSSIQAFLERLSSETILTHPFLLEELVSHPALETALLTIDNTYANQFLPEEYINNLLKRKTFHDALVFYDDLSSVLCSSTSRKRRSFSALCWTSGDKVEEKIGEQYLPELERLYAKVQTEPFSYKTDELNVKPNTIKINKGKHMHRILNAYMTFQIGRHLLNHDGEGLRTDASMLSASLGGEFINKELKLLRPSKYLLLKKIGGLSPVIGKSIAALPILLTLPETIKHAKEGDTEAKIVLGSDIGYLGMMGVEAAAEMVGVDLAPETGGLSLLLMVGPEVYHVGKVVNQINTAIPLSPGEKILQGIRALAQQPPSHYLQTSLERHQYLEEVVNSYRPSLRGFYRAEIKIITFSVPSIRKLTSAIYKSCYFGRPMGILNQAGDKFCAPVSKTQTTQPVPWATDSYIEANHQSRFKRTLAARTLKTLPPLCDWFFNCLPDETEPKVQVQKEKCDTQPIFTENERSGFEKSCITDEKTPSLEEQKRLFDGLQQSEVAPSLRYNYCGNAISLVNEPAKQDIPPSQKNIHLVLLENREVYFRGNQNMIYVMSIKATYADIQGSAHHNDIFQIYGDNLTGKIQGRQGNNILDLTHYARSNDATPEHIIDLYQGLHISLMDLTKFAFSGIKTILGKSNRSETFLFNFKPSSLPPFATLIDGQGGSDQFIWQGNQRPLCSSSTSNEPCPILKIILHPGDQSTYQPSDTLHNSKNTIDNPSNFNDRVMPILNIILNSGDRSTYQPSDTLHNSKNTTDKPSNFNDRVIPINLHLPYSIYDIKQLTHHHHQLSIHYETQNAQKQSVSPPSWHFPDNNIHFITQEGYFLSPIARTNTSIDQVDTARLHIDMTESQENRTTLFTHLEQLTDAVQKKIPYLVMTALFPNDESISMGSVHHETFTSNNPRAYYVGRGGSDLYQIKPGDLVYVDNYASDQKVDYLSFQNTTTPQSINLKYQNNDLIFSNQAQNTTVILNNYVSGPHCQHIKIMIENTLYEITHDVDPQLVIDYYAHILQIDNKHETTGLLADSIISQRVSALRLTHFNEQSTRFYRVNDALYIQDRASIVQINNFYVTLYPKMQKDFELGLIFGEPRSENSILLNNDDFLRKSAPKDYVKIFQTDQSDPKILQGSFLWLNKTEGGVNDKQAFYLEYAKQNMQIYYVKKEMAENIRIFHWQPLLSHVKIGTLDISDKINESINLYANITHGDLILFMNDPQLSDAFQWIKIHAIKKSMPLYLKLNENKTILLNPFENKQTLFKLNSFLLSKKNANQNQTSDDLSVTSRNDRKKRALSEKPTDFSDQNIASSASSLNHPLQYLNNLQRAALSFRSPQNTPLPPPAYSETHSSTFIPTNHNVIIRNAIVAADHLMMIATLIVDSWFHNKNEAGRKLQAEKLNLDTNDHPLKACNTVYSIRKSAKKKNIRLNIDYVRKSEIEIALKGHNVDKVRKEVFELVLESIDPPLSLPVSQETIATIEQIVSKHIKSNRKTKDNTSLFKQTSGKSQVFETIRKDDCASNRLCCRK